MIYVMSDIHGNMRRFNSIIEQINLQPEDTLYILGDVIDRQPDGLEILQRIIKLPNAKMFLGNHEYMMLQALDRPYDKGDWLSGFDIEEARRLWYRNGGEITHKCWKEIPNVQKEEIIAYFHALPLNFDVDVNGIHYKLAHGAPTEEYDNCDMWYEGRTHFAVWKRWKPTEKHSGDYTLVFGHSPTIKYQSCCPMKVWKMENQIGIDCGSGLPDDPSCEYAHYGRLACLRLDDMKEFYSQEPWDSAK